VGLRQIESLLTGVLLLILVAGCAEWVCLTANDPGSMTYAWVHPIETRVAKR
jgi:hypothetical protein